MKHQNGDIHSHLGLLVRIVRKWTAAHPKPDAPDSEYKAMIEALFPVVLEAAQHEDVIKALVSQHYFADDLHSAIYADDEFEPPLVTAPQGDGGER